MNRTTRETHLEAVDFSNGSDPLTGETAIVGTPPSLGGYRIERLLGEGGMGAVYLARDDKLDRAVAIKTMKPEIAARPGAVKRFLREARAAAQITHDNIVPILHVGEDNGTPYIVMPRLIGEPLDELLKREPVPPLGVILKVGRETADGLAAAHARGLVHRDVKPANVWIEGNPGAPEVHARFRRVKILDFGLARPTNEDAHLSSNGAFVGTPAYVSPEQAKGEPVDFRTDLFSLGVMLYEMTTGHRPFVGPTAMAVLASIAVDQPKPPAARNPQVPVVLSDLIMRLLARDRNDRPKSAADTSAALREIGKQLVAARKAAAAGPLPTVVAYPHQHPAQFNPWTDIDETVGTEPPPGTESNAPAPTAKRRRSGLWLAAGFASILALLAVGAVILKITRPAEKNTHSEVTENNTGDGKSNPTVKPPQTSRNDAKATAWVLESGGTVWVRDIRPTAREPEKDDRILPLGELRGVPGGMVEGWPATGEWEVRNLRDLPPAYKLVGIALRSRHDLQIDTGLAGLKGLPDLEWIELFETPVSDVGLAHLAGLPKLRWLGLQRTKITNDGLVLLATCPELRGLRIGDNPPVNNAGLKHLAGFPKLEVLRLNGTGVTDEGLPHLKPLRQLRVIDVIHTPVTGLGFRLLKELPALTAIDLTGSKANDDGLAQIAEVKSLTTLVLSETAVSQAGVLKFQKALPNCKITSSFSQP